MQGRIGFITLADARTEHCMKDFKCLQGNKKWLFNDDCLKKDGTQGFIAIDTELDAIAGYVFVDKDNRIFSLEVNSSYRRQGVGDALLRKAIELGGNWLEVIGTNTNAINFYKKRGFQITKPCMCYSNFYGEIAQGFTMVLI